MHIWPTQWGVFIGFYRWVCRFLWSWTEAGWDLHLEDKLWMLRMHWGSTCVCTVSVNISALHNCLSLQCQPNTTSRRPAGADEITLSAWHACSAMSGCGFSSRCAQVPRTEKSVCTKAYCDQLASAGMCTKSSQTLSLWVKALWVCLLQRPSDEGVKHSPLQQGWSPYVCKPACTQKSKRICCATLETYGFTPRISDQNPLAEAS